MHDQLGLAGALHGDAERLDGGDGRERVGRAPNPRTCTDPDEIAPSRTARWLTDLSPGHRELAREPSGRPDPKAVVGHASTAGVATAP